MAIYFYVPRDEHGYLSNFAPYGVELDGAYWPTVEHYFQGAKFEGTDPSHRDAILATRSAKDAANLGRDRRRRLRPDWESVKEAVMLRALRKKFETHAKIRERLVATVDEELVENSPSDFYWGVGADGSGKNRLGHLLMQVRRELQENGRR